MPTFYIPSGQIDVEGLTLLAAGLERITGGGKIQVRQVVQLETENMPAFWALQDLLTGDFLKALPAPVISEETLEGKSIANLFEAKARPSTPEPEPMPKKLSKPRSFRVVATPDNRHIGQNFSAEAVAQGLRNGQFPPGTRFRHPKLGELVVSAKRQLEGWKQKKQKGGKPGRVMSRWEILDGEHAGEKPATQHLNRMLADHELAEGTHLNHPKLGRKVVLANALEDYEERLP